MAPASCQQPRVLTPPWLFVRVFRKLGASVVRSARALLYGRLLTSGHQNHGLRRRCASSDGRGAPKTAKKKIPGALDAPVGGKFLYTCYRPTE
eukprot:227624-Pyramimonas_sp.AAC.1